jgi:hypothetical protein
VIKKFHSTLYKKGGIPPHKKRCVTCKYSGCMHTSKNQSSLGSVYCDYIGVTGNRRPCPAENCTVYEPEKKKRKGRGKCIQIN